VIVAPGVWAQPTGSTVGAPQLAGNLKTFMDTGGKVMWTAYTPSHTPGGPEGGFDYAITPYSASGASSGVQSAGSSAATLIAESLGHPILNGLTNGASLAVNNNAGGNFCKTISNVRPGATTVASAGSPATTTNTGRLTLVTTMWYSGSRVSYHNNSTLEAFTNSNTTAAARRLFTNTVLWTAGMI
jgi:hypothetical protein